MRHVVLLLLLLLAPVWLASACAITPRDFDLGTAPSDAGVDAAGVPADDSDSDGLCNVTEEELGSSPSELDSDQDGYPDVIEVINGFDPVDRESPGLAQVGFLVAEHGASHDFETRVTVDALGEGYTGSFSAYPALNANDLTAEDFLARGLAVSAEPPENARGIDPASERFGSVLGHTRLMFSLRFEYTQGPDDFSCTEAFSFAYGAKNDLGKRKSPTDYMLIVTPKDSLGLEAKSFCLPESCL